MSQTPLLIDRVEAEDAVLLYLRGELDLGTVALLRAALAGLPGRAVIIDLGDLTFMDSTGLAALLEQSRSEHVQVRGAQGRVRVLFERTGVLDVFGAA
jgi:anti-sigma B factor antagonist